MSPTSYLAVPLLGLVQVRSHGLTNKPLNFDLTPEELAAGRHQVMKSSIYTGVGWDKRKKKWLARGNLNGSRAILGVHDTEIEAARAYDVWAQPLGKNLNFPENYKGQKVITLAYVRPAALPEVEARAHAMDVVSDRAAVEPSAQELHDLQNNAESRKILPTKKAMTIRKKKLLHNIKSDSRSVDNVGSTSLSSGDSDSSIGSSNDDNEDKGTKKQESSNVIVKKKQKNGPSEESLQEPSDYELLRLQNIARNQAVIEALGLDMGNRSSNRHKRSEKQSKQKSAKGTGATMEARTTTHVAKKNSKTSKWACHMVRYIDMTSSVLIYLFTAPLPEKN